MNRRNFLGLCVATPLVRMLMDEPKERELPGVNPCKDILPRPSWNMIPLDWQGKEVNGVNVNKPFGMYDGDTIKFSEFHASGSVVIIGCRIYKNSEFFTDAVFPVRQSLCVGDSLKVWIDKGQLNEPQKRLVADDWGNWCLMPTNQEAPMACVRFTPADQRDVQDRNLVADRPFTVYDHVRESDNLNKW